MEITFETQLLIDLYQGKKIKEKEFRSNPSLIKQYIKTVQALKSAPRIETLLQLGSLHYEKLKGNRKGTSSVRVNDQYRLIFSEISNENMPSEIVILNIEELSKHYQ